MKAAGQYAGLEDDGFFINHEAPASQGGTMPTLFSTTGLDVTETGKAPARMSGGFLAECDCIRLLQAIKLGNRNHILISDCANHIASEGHGDTVIAIAQGIRQGNFKVICSNLALSILVITLRTRKYLP